MYHHKPHQLTNDFYIKVYVSFDEWKYIPREKFEWIEEWHAETERKYFVGVIHFNQVVENTWWKENRTSLILSPEPIIEDFDVIKLKKRSLELAGVV